VISISYIKNTPVTAEVGLMAGKLFSLMAFSCQLYLVRMAYSLGRTEKRVEVIKRLSAVTNVRP
jgi:hypothetical protein